MGAPPSSVAVVSTVLHSLNFREWLGYHCAIGIEHFYIFFDDPADPNKAVAHEFGDVVTVLDNQAPDSPITKKQSANVKHALGLGRGKYRWLLHIDDDELLHLFPGHTLADLLYMVPAHIFDLHFRNLEVCKTVKSVTPYNFFAEEEYFYTRRRRSYRNGKSAGRVDFPRLRPYGPHYFTADGPQTDEPEAALDSDSDDDEPPTCTNVFEPQKPSKPAGRVTVNRAVAVVLHYPFMVYEKWKAKCGRPDLREWKVDWGYYRASKKVILQCGEDDHQLREHFLSSIMSTPKKLEALIRAGKILHVPGPSLLLGDLYGTAS